MIMIRSALACSTVSRRTARSAMGAATATTTNNTVAQTTTSVQVPPSANATAAQVAQQQQQQQQRRFVHVERKLEEKGIVLPKPAGPRANYSPVMRIGDMMYVSGHLPFDTEGNLMTGRIGDTSELDLDHGYNAARLCGLNLISTIQANLDGDLDRVVKVVKLFGIVQSHETFKSQHLVMDGCSDIMMEVFGEDVGLHARSAIGTSTLPLNMSVEVEGIVQVRD